jgi:hypothetical protein
MYNLYRWLPLIYSVYTCFAGRKPITEKGVK